MRPSTVPPVTRAPFLAAWRRSPWGRGGARRASGPRGRRRPWRAPSWSSPPAGLAFVRAGWANRRSLAGSASGSAAPEAARRSLAGAAGFARLDGARAGLAGLGVDVGLLVRDAARFGLTPASGSARSRLRALRCFGDGVGLGDAPQAGVEVGVAVGVLELDVAAELARAAQADDAAVVDGDDRRALAAEDADRAAGAVGLDDMGGVAGRARSASRAPRRAGRRRRSPWRRRGSGPGSGRSASRRGRREGRR